LNYFNSLPSRGVALGFTIITAAAACRSETFDAPPTPTPTPSDDVERADTFDAGEEDASLDAVDRDATTALDAGALDGSRPFVLTDAIKVGYQPSFDPSRYSKACDKDAECAIVPAIQNCGTCCSGDTAVRADGALADLAAVRAACEWMNACSMACAPVHAECVDGECVVCGGPSPCAPSIVIELPIGEEGDWVVEASFDRRTARCALDQAPGPEKISCSAGSSLVRTGPRKISFGLDTTMTPATLTVRVERDGAEVASETFDVEYEAIPGPSRRGCKPRECRQARHTFVFGAAPLAPGGSLVRPGGMH